MKCKLTQHGAAVIEFAIVLLPMITIVFGITEFGRAIYQYNTVVKATRDAARYLTMQQPGNPDNEYSKASCLVKYGDYNCTTTPSLTGTLLAPGLASATISICDSTMAACLGAGVDPNLVKVTVSNYQFQSLVPFVTANSTKITFSDISTTMRGQ